MRATTVARVTAAAAHTLAGDTAAPDITTGRRGTALIPITVVTAIIMAVDLTRTPVITRAGRIRTWGSPGDITLTRIGAGTRTVPTITTTRTTLRDTVTMDRWLQRCSVVLANSVTTMAQSMELLDRRPVVPLLLLRVEMVSW